MLYFIIIIIIFIYLAPFVSMIKTLTKLIDAMQQHSFDKWTHLFDSLRLHSFSFDISLFFRCSTFSFNISFDVRVFIQISFGKIGFIIGVWLPLEKKEHCMRMACPEVQKA